MLFNTERAEVSEGAAARGGEGGGGGGFVACAVAITEPATPAAPPSLLSLPPLLLPSPAENAYHHPLRPALAPAAAAAPLLVPFKKTTFNPGEKA